MSLQEADVQSVLDGAQGIGYFTRALERCESNEQLLKVLGQFVAYSGCFPSAILALAAQLSGRDDLFRDRHDLVPTFADRALEIGGLVKMAADDEFGNPLTGDPPNHRKLAVKFLRHVGRYRGVESDKLDRLVIPTVETKDMIRQCQRRYGLWRTLSDIPLFQAIGIHLWSERIAQQEFETLYTVLPQKHSGLVTFLKETKVWHWVTMHCSVEEDHAKAALLAANRAMEYYAGNKSPAKLKSDIMSGGRHFKVLHNNFMRSMMGL